MPMTDELQAALEIVKAQAGARPMTEDEIVSMIGNVAHGIQVAAGTMPVPDPMESTTMAPAKAIKEASVTCLECGKSFKIITKKHLASHGLTPEEYREKYGYKKGAPLAAKSLQRERRKKMKEMKLWERRTKKPAEGEKA